MGKEQGNIPAWARRERQQDMGWISENYYVFAPTAAVAFEQDGERVLVVETTIRPSGTGHPFGYFREDFFADEGDEDVRRRMRDYDPAREFVVVMLKPQNRRSTYRI